VPDLHCKIRNITNRHNATLPTVTCGESAPRKAADVEIDVPLKVRPSARLIY